MIEEHTRTALQQQQWTLSEDVNPVTQETSVVQVWKQYTNGVAITLSIYYEEGQFVLDQDVGHAASGSKRTNCGTFATANAAEHQLSEACDSWDQAWGM